MALRIGPRLGEYACITRNKPTEPKVRLWQTLWSLWPLQLAYKFSRQIVIGGAVCDPPCRMNTRIIAVDSDTHASEVDRPLDARPTSLGYRTLRFANREMMNSLAGVTAAIVSALDERIGYFIRSPIPLLEREGAL